MAIETAPMLCDAAPWPQRETPAFCQIGNKLLNEPNYDDDGSLRWDEALYGRQQARLEEANLALTQLNNKKAELEDAIRLNEQLRLQQSEDVSRISEVLARLDSVKPKPRPLELLKGRDRFMKMIADFYYAATLGNGKDVLLNFPVDLLRECLDDFTEVSDDTTGINSRRICRGLLGVLFGKTVHDAAHMVLYKLNGTRVDVRVNERRY